MPITFDDYKVLCCLTKSILLILDYIFPWLTSHFITDQSQTLWYIHLNFFFLMVTNLYGYMNIREVNPFS
jgi:hypothetical protein